MLSAMSHSSNSFQAGDSPKGGCESHFIDTIDLMPGRLRSFALLLPILLLGSVLLFWARSYLPEEIHFRSHQGRLLIFFVTGEYVHWFDQSSAQYSGSQTAMDFCQRVAEVQSMPALHLGGFEWVDLNFKSSYPGYIAIPYWALAALLAALSVWAMLRRRAQRERFLPGHCRAYGYDLRGSNGKCPECGAETQAAAQTTSTAAAG